MLRARAQKQYTKWGIFLTNKQFGNLGEKEAQKYLKKKKYKIIETNYRIKSAEIDIIAYDKNTLCFIEVKTRSSKLFGLPCEAVDVKKRQKIIQGAMWYIAQNDIENEIRFDVIEVFASEKNDKFKMEKINLIKNAFTN